jgi:CheY-like chemotaxis protein
MEVLAPSPAADESPGMFRSIVVVLDNDTSWPTGSSRRLDMEIIPPTRDVAERIARLTPSGIVANLAAAGALDVMLALRECGCASDFWGCLAAPGQEEVVPVGMVEPARAPLDVDVVLEWIRGFAARGTRVLAAGDNVNAFISLRAALVREGMSVATAWDSRQTVDLLTMVRPQVVVLDLTLPPHGAQVVLAQLAALEPLPATFLVASGGDPAPGFLRALKDAGEELECVSRATCLTKFQIG